MFIDSTAYMYRELFHLDLEREEREYPLPGTLLKLLQLYCPMKK